MNQNGVKTVRGISEAIKELQDPKNKKRAEFFSGIIQHLSNFLSNQEGAQNEKTPKESRKMGVDTGDETRLLKVLKKRNHENNVSSAL